MTIQNLKYFPEPCELNPVNCYHVTIQPQSHRDIVSVIRVGRTPTRVTATAFRFSVPLCLGGKLITIMLRNIAKDQIEVKPG